ncbi:hypothetical protein [Kocuria sp. CPCC 205263]|uniref:hypothetical protein n=1 Tax=Kocuria sp. CPCC 205263 TaxID=3073555 RepID=UPI0034D57967
MTKRQAVKALEEYLVERADALTLLREELAADGIDPDTLLDGTPASLTPVWRWVASRITAMEDDPAPISRDAPAPPWWPSWARYTADLRRSTPAEVVALLDGFVSYLGDVTAAGAPQAQWQVCQHRVKRYWLQSHPVLKSPVTDADIYLPSLVTVTANRLRSGLDPLREDEFTKYGTAVITRLRGESEPVPVAEEEPLVEVEEEEDGVFDIGLHEEIAHEHFRKVDRMVKDLTTQPGIVSAHREDREMLLVTAPDWDAEQLEQWVTDWLTAGIPELG